MIELIGKYGKALIYTSNIEEEAKEQIIKLLNLPAFSDANIKVMPDVHTGAGCVIGFTSTLTERIVPNLIGVDIGCGVLACKVGRINISFDKLDKFIRKEIPYGFERNKRIDKNVPEDLKDKITDICKKINLKPEEQLKGIGSLGGGNHFIEVDKDKESNVWVVIHSGSRNFGLQVAQYHQKRAKKYCEEQSKTIKDSKKAELYKVDKSLSFLEGKLKEDYLHDLSIAQRYAILNREIMMGRILDFLDKEAEETILSVHNYINFEDKIIRKGAIASHKGQKLLIPLNMRDGIIIAIGKGNKEWNYSAPHGAGRILSRTQAKKTLKLEEFKEQMKGIYTSCVSKDTIDESPAAYKPKQEIINAIKDTVEIIDVIKPVYNFKAGEE